MLLLNKSGKESCSWEGGMIVVSVYIKQTVREIPSSENLCEQLWIIEGHVGRFGKIEHHRRVLGISKISGAEAGGIKQNFSLCQRPTSRKQWPRRGH